MADISRIATNEVSCAFATANPERENMDLEPITQAIKAEIEKLTHVLRVLEGTGTRQTKAANRARPRRGISAAGRRRIAAAQRARWAKIRAGKK
jgi:hypothetical protein